jgi:predicted deacetylase
MKKWAKIILVIIIFISAILFIIFLSRLFLPKQLDDVSPSISTEENLLLKSESLMIIPIYENNSIAENKSWCYYILNLNKTLAMHGVYHTYKEFSETRDEEYIRRGAEEFKKCFGFYPQIFEAPQLALNRENRALLKEMGFGIKEWPNMLMRKVYHTQDTGIYAIKFGRLRITNKLIDII